jgi:hypothetical protein
VLPPPPWGPPGPNGEFVYRGEQPLSDGEALVLKVFVSSFHESLALQLQPICHLLWALLEEDVKASSDEVRVRIRAVFRKALGENANFRRALEDAYQHYTPSE